MTAILAATLKSAVPLLLASGVMPMCAAWPRRSGISR